MGKNIIERSPHGRATESVSYLQLDAEVPTADAESAAHVNAGKKKEYVNFFFWIFLEKKKRWLNEEGHDAEVSDRNVETM